MMVENVPSDIWIQILHYLDEETTKSCRLVSSTFKEIIDSDSFWIEKAVLNDLADALPPLNWRNALSKNQLPTLDEIDTETFRFNYGRMVFSGIGCKKFRPYEINKNLTLDEHKEKYNMTINPIGARLEIEENNVGCEPHDDVQYCLAFSYSSVALGIVIDLLKLGISRWILDYVRPKIVISQMFNHRFDCGAEANFIALLKNTDRETSVHLQTEDRIGKNYRLHYMKWNQWGETVWEKRQIVLEDYSSGMRYLHIKTIGSDTQFWEGFYGPKIANLEVEIIFPNEIRLLPYESTTEDCLDHVYPLVRGFRNILPRFRAPFRRHE